MHSLALCQGGDFVMRNTDRKPQTAGLWDPCNVLACRVSSEPGAVATKPHLPRPSSVQLNPLASTTNGLKSNVRKHLLKLTPLPGNRGRGRVWVVSLAAAMVSLVLLMAGSWPLVFSRVGRTEWTRSWMSSMIRSAHILCPMKLTGQEQGRGREVYVCCVSVCTSWLAILAPWHEQRSRRDRI